MTTMTLDYLSVAESRDLSAVLALKPGDHLPTDPWPREVKTAYMIGWTDAVLAAASLLSKRWSDNRKGAV